jgi:hypothetical protein
LKQPCLLFLERVQQVLCQPALGHPAVVVPHLHLLQQQPLPRLHSLAATSTNPVLFEA